ncbi:MAG: thiamine biosynthesis protein ThiF [Anaerolinea sp.]|nr:thiamine biosynthesis protein ThiF [Anaerolinea sp.]
MNGINLDYVQAARLKLPTYEKALLVLVGCGGTGSWLAPAVARVARLLQERFDKETMVVFADPDLVEEKNVYRQNFCAAEIGRNKAVTLAERYGLSWGIEIVSVARALELASEWWNGLSRNMIDHRTLAVMIGCVDGHTGRKAIDSCVQAEYRPVWWLDCGNEKNSGQVLLGRSKNEEKPFSLPGFCSWLPLPSAQAPDLVVGGEMTINASQVGISCAEMALQDSQGLAINQRMASEAADFLVRMLITQDLRKMATYIDLESGVSRSRYITPGNVSMETVRNA